MNLRCLFSVFCAFAVLWREAVSAADWPRWRGPTNDGKSSEQVDLSWPATGPKLLWQANVGTGMSSVSIKSGRVYTLGNTNEQDTIWCLDEQSGRELWHLSYRSRLDPQYYDGGPNSTPTIEGDRVFTLSKWGHVFCLDAPTGKVLWKRELWDQGIRSNRWGFAGSPIIWKNLVLLNAGEAGCALDKDTGKTVWSNGTNVAGYATPQLIEGTSGPTLLIFGAKNLYALEPASGRELWRQPFVTGYNVNNTDPLLHQDRVFLSSYSRGCALLPLDSGQPIYTNKNLRCHLGPGIVFGDYLYAFSGEANVDTDFRCIHLPTGQLKWTRKDPKLGALMSVNGKLLIISEKGELIVAEVSPEEYRPIARAQVLEPVCWTPPSLANGRLYLRNSKGKVVCLDLRASAPRS